VKDGGGRDALKWAEAAGKSDVIELLKKTRGGRQ
jgi:hypothetical protein